MPKSPDAFRTISEVADWLGIQAHVLRFWESKFTQVKPIKRAGGRRYYRPADMLLLGGIKKLLHDDGLTIKGVQKILREEGMSHVAAMSLPLDDAEVEFEVTDVEPTPKLMQSPAPEPESVVLPFEAPKDVVKDVPEDTVTEDAEVLPADEVTEARDATPEDRNDLHVEAAQDEEKPEEVSVEAAPAEAESETPALTATEPVHTDETPEPEKTMPEEVLSEADAPDILPVEAAPEQNPPEQPEAPQAVETAPEQPVAAAPVEQDTRPGTDIEAQKDEALPDIIEEVATTDADNSDVSVDDAPEVSTQAALPAFMRKAEPEPDETTPAHADQPQEQVKTAEQPPVIEAKQQVTPAQVEETSAPAHSTSEPEAAPEAEQPPEPTPMPEPTPEPEPEQAAEPEPVAPKPRDIGMPQVTPEQDIHAEIATLAHASRVRSMDTATAQKVAPLLTQLTALRDRMAARRGGTQPKF